MLLINPLLSLLFGDGSWIGVVALIAVAAASAYAGWVAVEYIPFTRRILERREGGGGRE